MTQSSEEEWKLVDVNIRGNVSDLTSVDGDLVCKHTGGRHLDRVWPVVVVEAEGVGEVKDCILRNLGRVVSYVEMSWLDSSLSDIVRYQEEVKLSVNNLGLLDKSLVYIGTLGWVLEFSCFSIKESLSDSLVYNDECDVRRNSL